MTRIDNPQPANRQPAPTSRPAPELQCTVDDTPETLALKTSHFVEAPSLPSGSALGSVAFAIGSSPDIVKLLGLRQGDKLEVDGIATANGTGKIKELSPQALEIQAEINIPWGTQGLASKDFKLVDAKVNLSIRVEKKGDSYYYKLLDNNSGKTKGSGQTEISVKDSSFSRSSTFGYNPRTVQKQVITVTTSDGDITISIENDPKGKVTGSFTVPTLPSFINQFDFTKQ